MPVIGIGDLMSPSMPPYWIGDLRLPGNRCAINMEFEQGESQKIWYLKYFKTIFVTVTNVVNF